MNDNRDSVPPQKKASDDTIRVLPPSYRERILAAQKARTNEIRQSVEIPNPLLKKVDSPDSDKHVPQEPDEPGKGKISG